MTSPYTQTTPIRPVTLLSLAVGIVFLWLAACAPTTERPSRPPTPTVTEPLPIPDEPPAPSEIIRIGVLLPLSGEHARTGQSLLNAASFAAFDSSDTRLTLLPRDTRGTPDGAISAARELLESEDGVDIIVGPLLGPAIRAVAPLAQEQGVKVIGLSNDSMVAGNGVYLLGFMPESEVARIVEYATLQGYHRFAALIPNTPYGDRVGSTFEREVRGHGGTLTDYEIYPPESAELYEPVRNLTHYDDRQNALEAERTFLNDLGEDDLAHEILKALERLDTLGDVDYEAVLIPEGAALLRTLVPLLPYYDVDSRDVKFLGTGLWHDPSVALDTHIRGGWFAAPPPDVADRFAARYKTHFGDNPPRIATLAYDAVALVAALARDRETPDFSDKALTDINGYLGIDGPFRFHANGVVERKLAIMEVTRDGFRIISAAPRDFIPVPDMRLSPPAALDADSLTPLSRGPRVDPPDFMNNVSISDSDRSGQQMGNDTVEHGTPARRGLDGAGDAFDELQINQLGEPGHVDESVNGGTDPSGE